MSWIPAAPAGPEENTRHVDFVHIPLRMYSLTHFSFGNNSRAKYQSAYFFLRTIELVSTPILNAQPCQLSLFVSDTHSFWYHVTLKHVIVTKINFDSSTEL